MSMRIIAETYTCAYCGGDIDPANPAAHVELCREHPSYRYKVALAKLLRKVDEAAALPAIPADIKETLQEAAKEAREIATGKPS